MTAALQSSIRRPGSLRRAVLMVGWWLGIYVPPDRAVLAVILRYLAERSARRPILFVGVRYYTRRYFRNYSPDRFATMDPNPAMRHFGGSTHVEDRLERLGNHFADGFFSAIVVNGVFGWGLSEPQAVDTALTSCAMALEPGGWLVVGVNEKRVETPDLRLSPALGWFELAEFPAVAKNHLVVATPFLEREHTYLFFRRRNCKALEKIS